MQLSRERKKVIDFFLPGNQTEGKEFFFRQKKLFSSLLKRQTFAFTGGVDVEVCCWLLIKAFLSFLERFWRQRVRLGEDSE